MILLDVVGRSMSVSKDVATSTMLSSPSVTLGFVLRPSLIFGLSHDKAGHVFENSELTFQ